MSTVAEIMGELELVDGGASTHVRGGKVTIEYQKDETIAKLLSGDDLTSQCSIVRNGAKVC